MKKYLVMALLVVCGLATQTFAAAKTAEATLDLYIYFDGAEITFGDGSTDDAFNWDFYGLDIPYVNDLTSGAWTTDIGDGSASGGYDATINGEAINDFANNNDYLLPGDVIHISFSGQAMSDTPNSIQNVSVVVNMESSFDVTNIGLNPDDVLTLYFSYDWQFDSTLNNALPLPGGTTATADGDFNISADTVSYEDIGFITVGFGDLLDNTPTAPNQAGASSWDAQFTYSDYFGEVNWSTDFFVGVNTQDIPEPASLALLAAGTIVIMRRKNA